MNVTQLRSILKKKTLFGYDSDDINHQFEAVQREIKEEEESLERRYQNLKAENKVLKSKLNELENKKQDDTIEKKISSKLLYAHMENSNRIIEAKQKIENHEKEVRESLERKRREKTNLKGKLSEAIRHLQTNQ